VLNKLKSKAAALFKKQFSVTRQSKFVEIGFHGDEYLLSLAESLSSRSNVFVETGSNVGSTLAYVAKNRPQLRCFSCEPDQSAFEQAVANTRKYSNVVLFKGTSQEFIEHLTKQEPEIFSERCFFWLDAHGYGFEWPLKDELEFITQKFKSGYILIDDFKVPGRDDFIYDVYEGQVCSYDFVKDSLNPEKTYQLYYPAYRDKTSKHHPLCGWGLLIFGDDSFQMPEAIRNKVERAL
jgi:hypothetical protein